MSVTGPGCERCYFTGTVAIPGNAWTRKPCDHCGGLSAFAHHNPNTPITTAIPSPDSSAESAASDTIARLTRERDEARASLAAAHRELHRIACGEQIVRAERDAIAACADQHFALRRRWEDGYWERTRERDTARRWSRLWHAEARRLWREVQAAYDESSEVIDDN